MSTGLRYEYNITDHLGNVRMVVADLNSNGKIDQTTNPATNEVLQETHYYPFGMRFDGPWAESTLGAENNYLYNGKELVEDAGLEWYAYGARYYDPAIGRFTGVDALADDLMQVDKSPYAYAWNNPISLKDPDGNCPWCVGAIVGAAVDYGTQVATNLAGGQSIGDALTDVDGGSIATSAALGAVGGGLLGRAANLVRSGKASQLAKNARKGADFERKVVREVSKTQDDVVEQITVKTNSGTRTRLDVVGRDKGTGKVKLTEAKSSETAPLTRNQKKAFPEIQEQGATVVGKGKGSFPGGTNIPPTKVQIKRPEPKPWWKIW